MGVGAGPSHTALTHHPVQRGVAGHVAQEGRSGPHHVRVARLQELGDVRQALLLQPDRSERTPVTQARLLVVAAADSPWTLKRGPGEAANLTPRMPGPAQSPYMVNPVYG